MRIGIDATALPPKPVGAGNYIIQLIRSLSNLESDYEFVVFAHQSGLKLINTFDEQGFAWVVVPDKKPLRRLIWEQTVFPIMVRRYQIDLLHSLHYTRPFALSCSSVVTFHDMTFFLYPHLHTRPKRIFFPLTIQLSARNSDALIAVSESTRQDSIRLLGVSPQKIFTVPLGVTEDFRSTSDTILLTDVSQRYELPEKFILYVGLVEPRKNLPFLLQTYRHLIDKGIPHDLVIVGRFGWMYQDVFTQVEELKLRDRVHFTGYVSHQDLPIVYNLASLFVYPTRYEGFGLPVLEAMACGTPIVSSAVSSLPEIVGDAGILVPPGDQAALSRAMLDVLSNRTLQKQLTTKGRHQAAQFTWERTAQKTLKVYQHVLEGA